MKLPDLFEAEDTLELPDIEVGDTVLVGKFKNRKAVVKGFTTDDKNQPVLKTDKGDTKVFKPRIAKLLPPKNALHEMLLYRGDASLIADFDIGKTDTYALFGMGIYLTDDPLIAHDYTAARAPVKVYPATRDDEPCRSVKACLQGYAISKSRTFDERRFRDEWVRQRGLGDRYNGLPSHTHDTMNREMEQAKQDVLRRGMAGAIAAVRQELPSLRALKLTTGEVILVRRDREAVISAFDIPEDYLSRMLHADRPLPDHALAAIKAHWLSIYPNDNADLRDRDFNTLKGGFDAYVRHYRTRGSRYAWRDDDDGDALIGGKGQNPSLDDLWNGTHSGSYVFTDGWTSTDERPKARAFIKAMLEAGYVGLEYDGGKRIGGHLRGGGGRRHRAFVLWDTKALAGFRRDHHAFDDPSKGISPRSLPRL